LKILSFKRFKKLLMLKLQQLTRSLLTLTLFSVICLWTIGLGWGMASALEKSSQSASTSLISAQATPPKSTAPKPQSKPTPKKSPTPKPSPSGASQKPKPSPQPSASPSPKTSPSSSPSAQSSPSETKFIYSPAAIAPNQPMSVDPVPTRYEPGFQAYLETCASCHIAIPPEALPTESWREILRKPDNHFGVVIPNYNRLTQLLIWDYMSNFSRPLPPDSPLPLYVEKSRYFKALHPRVTMPPDMTSKSCVTCHPNVANFNFRTLTPEWNDAP
jgi:hypothetical protein